jgi:glycosyltransferase involved in cell wall biosynthesis
MGLMESMASGVPVVSTRVGMAPDLILDQTTGGLARPEDAEDIADKALGLLSLPKWVLAGLRSRAREAVQVCDWSVVGRRHFEEVYRPLLADAS